MSTGTSAPAGRQAADGARQAADQAQDKAQQVATQARSTLREQLDQRSAQAAGQINQQAADLRAVGHSLREQDKEGPAKAADRVAEYAEKVGGYLQDKDSDALLSDAEDFGRRQPWAVGAGALALGFAASRFLKASSGRRYATRSGGAPGRSSSLPAQSSSPAMPFTGDVPPLPPAPPRGSSAPGRTSGA